MKLSIVVPIYNKGKFLCSLFNSIFAQGLDESDFELLLIDDGSTDNSKEICDTFIANNPALSIKYVYQSNTGVSAARNHGIALAQGKYIHFMDSDDILADDSYRYILDNFVSSNADYIGFDMEWLDLRGQLEPRNLANKRIDGKIIKKTTGINHIIETTWPSTCVLGLYRTSFLKRHKIQFPVGVMIGEDVYFNFDFFSKNPQCVMTSCKAYVYCMREQSAMTTISYEKAEKWFYSYHTFLSHLVDGQCFTPPMQTNGIQNVINHHIAVFIPKILQFGLTEERFKWWAAQFISSSIVPLYGERSIYRFANFLFTHPRLYPLLSWIYRNILYSIYRRLHTH